MAYTFDEKKYIEWIKNTDTYKKAPAGSPLKNLASKEAQQTYREMYADHLSRTEGMGAVEEFLKKKPFSPTVKDFTVNVTEGQDVMNEPGKSYAETIEGKSPYIPLAAETKTREGMRETDPYAKFLRGSDYKEKQLLSDLASSKAYKGQAIAGLGLAGLSALGGLGQFLKGRKKEKALTPPKYPAEMLPNQQLASRLAQAQVEAQMADPVIREKLLSDLASQKMVADEIARATSGGDISAYAGLSQANAGNISKALRDIAVQEGVDKLRKQQVLDQLIGAKMGEERQAYQDKLAKFTNVDYPEFQAQREYVAALKNKGLGNLLASVKSGSEMVAPMIQSKSIQQGMMGQLQSLSPEKKAEMAKKYPALKKYLSAPQQLIRTEAMGSPAQLTQTQETEPFVFKYGAPTTISGTTLSSQYKKYPNRIGSLTSPFYFPSSYGF